MSTDAQNVSPIEPPAEVPEIQRGNWLHLRDLEAMTWNSI